MVPIIEYGEIDLVKNAYKWWLKSRYMGKVPITGKGFWFSLKTSFPFSSEYTRFRREFLGNSPKFFYEIWTDDEIPSRIGFVDCLGYLHRVVDKNVLKYLLHTKFKPRQISLSYSVFKSIFKKPDWRASQLAMLDLENLSLKKD